MHVPLSRRRPAHSRWWNMAAGPKLAARVRACVSVVAVALALDATVVAASAQAPDGRAYELVSPTDKNGAGVTGDGVNVIAAMDGDAVVFSSRGSFGDTIGSGASGQTQYLARRAPNGWVTRGITPTPAPNAVQTFAGVTYLSVFSSSLDRGIGFGWDLPDAVSTGPVTNMYSVDTVTREVQTVTASQADPPGLEFTDSRPWGVSRDARHVSFTTTTRMLPEAPSGVPSVYEWFDGRLVLASVLPDGRPAADGATIPQQVYRRTVSPDGSRVLFVSPDAGTTRQLYMRIDQSRTAWVSQPETRDFDPRDPNAPLPENVVLEEVTGDSRHVLFSSTSRLLDGDTADGPDLYLYTDSDDPANDANLTLITNSGGVAGNGVGTSVIGSSEDASRIYFQTGNGTILLWDRGVTVPVAEGIYPGINYDTELAAASSYSPGFGRVTGDGRYVAVLDAIPGSTSGQIYLYDADQETLHCVSCLDDGSVDGLARVVPDVSPIFPRLDLIGLRPSYLAEDGRVFFSTPEALVGGDVNGVTDAYQYDPATQELSLLSTGQGSEPAAFADASASGRDVFIVTRQRLVGWDRDELLDMYDVRVGGGLPEPPAPTRACQGEACQGAPEQDEGDDPYGSATLQRGLGNGSARRGSLPHRPRCEGCPADSHVASWTRHMERQRPAARHAQIRP